MYVCMYVCKLLFRVVNSKQPNTYMEVILAVKNTTLVVVKIRPEKNSGPYGILIHDLCDTGASSTSELTSQLK